MLQNRSGDGECEPHQALSAPLLLHLFSSLSEPPFFTSMASNLVRPHNHLEGLFSHRSPGPIHRVSELVDWGLGFEILHF
jgi:hypothetical protein